MYRFSVAELLIQDDELRLTENDVIQMMGCIKNPQPGSATIVLLLIQPNQCPTVKSVNLWIPETKKGEKMGNSAFSTQEGENVSCTQLTIKILREYSDGMISGDVLTI